MSKEVWIVTKTSMNSDCWLQVPEVKLFNTYEQAFSYYSEISPPQDEFNYVQKKSLDIPNKSEFTYQVGGYCKGYSFSAKEPYGVKIEKSYI